MIFGIGVDIFSLAEVKLSVKEFGVILFAEQYCRDEEIEYISAHKNPILSLAEHLSLKEAVAKAFGTGLIEEFYFDDIQIDIATPGSPKIFISENSTEFLEHRIVKSTFGIHASISCSEEYTLASCVVIRTGNEWDCPRLL